MNYQQFVIVIKEKVALSLGAGMNLQIHTTLKNNGKERIGLSIEDKKINIHPTIYLEEYYKQFKNGNSIEDIAQNILNVYQEVRFEHTFDIESIKDFSLTQSKITYKIIHAQKNETPLQSLPHILYLDLAIVFYVLFEVDTNGCATIPITHQLLELWEKDVEELHQIALANSPELLPAVFKPMRAVVEDLLGLPCDEEGFDEDIMFVLTNPWRSFGAACMLYNGILEQIAATLGENYYILPSSIHEIIVIPESQAPCKEHLMDMVREVNETQVDLEDILSDNVYYYDFASKTLCP